MNKFITKSVTIYTATARVYNTEVKQEEEYIVEAQSESELGHKVKKHDVLIELRHVGSHVVRYKLSLDKFISEAEREMAENA